MRLAAGHSAYLKTMEPEWANFLETRWTHSPLMSELNVDPKVVAEQLGHILDVDQNVYTRAGLHRRQSAVDLARELASRRITFEELTTVVPPLTALPVLGQPI